VIIITLANIRCNTPTIICCARLHDWTIGVSRGDEGKKTEQGMGCISSATRFCRSAVPDVQVSSAMRPGEALRDALLGEPQELIQQQIELNASV
jgi:hypothetical protein